MNKASHMATYNFKEMSPSFDHRLGPTVVISPQKSWLPPEECLREAEKWGDG